MSDKIADNPSFKNFEDQLRNLGYISSFMPWLLTKEQKQKLKHNSKPFIKIHLFQAGDILFLPTYN